MPRRHVAALTTPDRGLSWNVVFDGETIVTGKNDPEHAACRALLARGITGAIEFRHENGAAGMQFGDIAEAAKWSMEERKNGKPTFRHVRWRDPAERLATLTTPLEASASAPETNFPALAGVDVPSAGKTPLTAVSVEPVP